MSRSRSTTAPATALVLAVLLVGACAPSTVTPSTDAALSASPAAIAYPLATTGPSAPTASAKLDPVAAARADLDKLVAGMEDIHPDLFRDMPEADWRAEVQRLDAFIPELVPDQPERLYVEFLRLAAMPGRIGGRNGHLAVRQQEPRPVLGIVTYTFADGVYVTRALPPNEDLVGGRITAVEGHPIDEVRDLLDPLIPRDNEWTPEIWFIDYFHQPEILVGLGILDTVGPVELTVEPPDGASRTVEVGLVPRADLLTFERPNLSWASRDYAESVMLHYLPQRPGATWTKRIVPMWWTTLHDGATLYVQQNMLEPPRGATLDEILVAAREPAVERVILDLRQNLGGDDDGGTLRTFQDEAIDHPGRLFVITSTNNFSAAPPLISRLDRTTGAVLVGEPTGGSPMFFWAGNRSVSLDHLPIPIRVDVSSQLGAGDLGDERLTIEPDIAVPPTGTDCFGDRDPALEAILATAP